MSSGNSFPALTRNYRRLSSARRNVLRKFVTSGDTITGFDRVFLCPRESRLQVAMSCLHGKFHDIATVLFMPGGKLHRTFHTSARTYHSILTQETTSTGNHISGRNFRSEDRALPEERIQNTADARDTKNVTGNHSKRRNPLESLSTFLSDTTVILARMFHSIYKMVLLLYLVRKNCQFSDKKFVLFF
jgi:hypothetical protein